MKYKIKRTSDDAFVINPSATIISVETDKFKAFEFNKPAADSCMKRLGLMFPKEKFELVEIKTTKQSNTNGKV